MMSHADKQAVVDALAEQLCLCGGIIEQIGSKIGAAIQRKALDANVLIDGTVSRITRVATRQSNKAADLLHSTQVKIDNAIKDNRDNCTAICEMVLKKIDAALPERVAKNDTVNSRNEQAVQGLMDKQCCERICDCLNKIVTVLEEIRNRMPYLETGEKGDVDEFVNQPDTAEIMEVING